MSAIFRLSLDVTCDCSEVKFAQDEVACSESTLQQQVQGHRGEREEIKRWLSRRFCAPIPSTSGPSSERAAGEHPNDLIRARARMLTLPVQQSVSWRSPSSQSQSLSGLVSIWRMQKVIIPSRRPDHLYPQIID